jgi:hypothetical protein
MAYKSELQQIVDEIEEAKSDVVNAYRDGDFNKRVRADRTLADLHHQFRECAGGRIPDER